MDGTQLINSLFFRPERGFFITPDQLGLAYVDMVFRARDGTGLHGWFVPSGTSDRSSRDAVTILFMHGVAGNISHRVENAAALRANLEANVFLFDYRGYGRSGGEPTEEGTYMDAEAAFETVCRRQEVDPERIILFGHSLGGAVAIELAVRLGRRVHGLIVESSFASGREVTRFLVPVMPPRMLGNAIPDLYNSQAKVGRVEAPLLITHGEEDSLLPLAMGEALYQAAREPKFFFPVPGAAHHDVYQAGGPAYYEQLASFVDYCDSHTLER